MAVNTLYDHLERLHPGIRENILKSCTLTINEEYVDVHAGDGIVRMLHKGDEVAIIPPVSSG